MSHVQTGFQVGIRFIHSTIEMQAPGKYTLFTNYTLKKLKFNPFITPKTIYLTL